MAGPQEIQTTTPDFTTIPGLLRILNKNEKVLSREAAYRAAKLDKFPTYRMGRKIFVRLSEVLEALRTK